jgi:hypothetical protein
MEWGALLGAFGVGAIFKSVIDELLSRRKSKEARKYQEKREAYLGLLDALHLAAVTPGDANSKNFALWQTKVSIFGSERVGRAVQGMIDTNDGPKEERQQYFRELLAAIREDLN